MKSINKAVNVDFLYQDCTLCGGFSTWMMSHGKFNSVQTIVVCYLFSYTECDTMVCISLVLQLQYYCPRLVAAHVAESPQKILSGYT